MNLLFSYGSNQDHKLHDDGNVFMGAAHDHNGSEVHVFMKKDETLASAHEPMTDELVQVEEAEQDLGNVAVVRAEKTFEHPDFDPVQEPIDQWVLYATPEMKQCTFDNIMANVTNSKLSDAEFRASITDAWIKQAPTNDNCEVSRNG